MKADSWDFNFYPYGVQYYRAPTPLPEEWETDLREIAKAGYTHIQLRPQWRWHERVRGEYCWDDLDTLFDLAAKYDLRVVLKPQLETAPDWVFTQLEGTRIGFNGIPISPIAHGAYYVGGWWPCFDNPYVVEAAQHFVERLTERFHLHRALWVYDAWNEPMSRPMGQCHCKHSTQSYRNWLEDNYGSIDDVNRAFGKAWTSFDTVFAPESSEDFIELYLFRTWAGFAVSQQAKFVSEAIRRVHPEAMILAHVALPLVTQDVAWTTSDDLQNVKYVDRYGTSFWINHAPKTPIEHATPELISSWLRRVDEKYWCHEFYPNLFNWCIPTAPSALRQSIWSAIAGGASALTFWQYRSERVGNETNGSGLREINGRPTSRSEVADSIGKVLVEKGNCITNTKRIPSQVAMVYSRESDMISRVSSMRHGMFSIAGETEDYNYPYKRAIKATHALLTANGTPPDWVVPGDDLTDVRMLVVTTAEILDDEFASWLNSFVLDGGFVLVEHPFSTRDFRTWVKPERPGHRYEELLGCREEERTIAQPEDHLTFRLAPIDGISIKAGGWRITLEPTGGRVVGHWSDGRIAAVQKEHGKGSVLSIGTSLGLSFDGASWESPEKCVYERLIQTLGVGDPIKHSPGLSVLRRQGLAHEVWFVINRREASGWVELPKLPSEVLEDSGCVINEAEAPSPILHIPPEGVWVGVISSVID